MPQAIYHSGYLLGTIGTAAIAFICVYMMQILLKSHYELCKRKKVSNEHLFGEDKFNSNFIKKFCIGF